LSWRDRTFGLHSSFIGCDTKSAEGVIDMLSNDDIDRLLAIGEQQRAELLAQGRDRARTKDRKGKAMAR
jgi:hypothetical protein